MSPWGYLARIETASFLTGRPGVFCDRFVSDSTVAAVGARMAYRPYSRRELDYHHAHGPPGPADAASTNTHNYYNGASNFHRTGPYSLQNRGRQDLEHYSTTSLHPTGSGFSNRDPQSLFRGGRDDYRSRQAAAVQSEQFHQDTGILSLSVLS